MRASTVAAIVAGVLLVALFALEAVAPRHEEVCGPDDFECWSPLRLLAQQMRVPVGVALAAAFFARVRPPWTQAVAIVACGCALLFLVFVALLGASPGTPCQRAPCVPTPLVVLTAGASWGACAGAVAGEAWPRLRQAWAWGIALGLAAAGATLVSPNM